MKNPIRNNQPAFVGGWHWLVIFSAILIAWLLMLAMSLPSSLQSTALGDATRHWQHAHHAAAGNTNAGLLFSMWALMALAMMGPSFVPTLRSYSDLISTGAATRGGFYALLAGYLCAWLFFAVAATYLQIGFADSALIDHEGRSLSLWLNVGLLLVAGAYQFSSIKEACLSQCRMPLTFFMENWRDGMTGAWRMGFRLGIVCVLCCWALMLLGFIGGVMSLLWMGLATLVMIIEKLPQIGHYLTKPTGAVLILSGIGLALWSL